jgi:hypothetical protein
MPNALAKGGAIPAEDFGLMLVEPHVHALAGTPGRRAGRTVGLQLQVVQARTPPGVLLFPQAREAGLRLKLPACFKVAPHTHPNDENVTVISGTFHVGIGDTFDERQGPDGQTRRILAGAQGGCNTSNAADGPRKK